MWEHRVNFQTIEGASIKLAATQDQQSAYLLIAIKLTSEIRLIDSIALHYPMELERAINIVTHAKEDTFLRAHKRLMKELDEITGNAKQ